MAMLISPGRSKKFYAAKLQFNATNKITEYKAILLGLRKARALRAKHAIVKTDSQLVACQIDKTYQAKNPELAIYFQMVVRMQKYFAGFLLKPRPRGRTRRLMPLRMPQPKALH